MSGRRDLFSLSCPRRRLVAPSPSTSGIGFIYNECATNSEWVRLYSLVVVHELSGRKTGIWTWDWWRWTTTRKKKVLKSSENIFLCFGLNRDVFKSLLLINCLAEILRDGVPSRSGLAYWVQQKTVWVPTQLKWICAKVKANLHYATTKSGVQLKRFLGGLLRWLRKGD